MEVEVDSKLLLDCLKKEMFHYLSVLRCEAILPSNLYQTMSITKECISNTIFILKDFINLGIGSERCHRNKSPRIVMLLHAIFPLMAFPTGALSKPLDG